MVVLRNSGLGIAMIPKAPVVSLSVCIGVGELKHGTLIIVQRPFPFREIPDDWRLAFPLLLPSDLDPAKTCTSPLRCLLRDSDLRAMFLWRGR